MTFIAWSILTYYVYPLKLLKIKGISSILFIAVMPFFLTGSTTGTQVFFFQSLMLTFCLHNFPGEYIFLKQLPVYKRYTAGGFIYALARGLTYVVCSFGLVYLTDCFGNYGVWIIGIPTCVVFLWGVKHFEGLEKQKSLYSAGSCGESFTETAA